MYIGARLDNQLGVVTMYVENRNIVQRRFQAWLMAQLRGRPVAWAIIERAIN